MQGTPLKDKFIPVTGHNIIVIFLILISIQILQSGCSWKGKNGERHNIILGFGVGLITTHNTNDISVVNTTGLGLTGSPWSATIGLGNQHIVEIGAQKRNDQVIEVRSKNHEIYIKSSLIITNSNINQN